eukprot:scaffold27434_cov50-Phaeocystis_antarctica.AAC.3
MRGSNLFAMLFALGRFNRAGLRTRGGRGGQTLPRRQGQLGMGRRARAPRQEGVHEIRHATCVRVYSSCSMCACATERW